MSTSRAESQDKAERDAAIRAEIMRQTKDKGVASQLTVMYKEFDLAEGELSNIFGCCSIAELQKESAMMMVLKEVMKYEGFNPREMMSLLYKKWKDNKTKVEKGEIGATTIEEEIMVGGNMEYFKISSVDPFVDDMKFLCLMFVTRGAAFEKIIKKSNKIMIKAMEMFKGKYGLNTAKRTPGTTLDRKAVTIPKIAASFPLITVSIFNAGMGRTIYEPGTAFGDAAAGIPRAFFSPMVSSMFPSSIRTPKPQLFLLNVLIDDVLHKKEPAKRTKLSDMLQYFEASLGSQAVTEEMKITACLSWGLITPEKSILPIIDSVKQLSVDKIRMLRGNDPNLEFVIDSLQV